MTDLETTTELMKGPLGDLLHKLAGPLFEEVGESFGVVAKHYRTKIALKMLRKTQRMLADAGIAPQAVSPRLFLPMLDAASVEDDEDMNSRWAALLANAAISSNAIHPSYIEILKQLSSEDARLLDQLFDFCHTQHDRKVNPWIGYVTYAEREQRIASGENPKIPFEKLVRLGLIQRVYDFDRQKVNVRVIAEDFKNAKFSASIDGELDDYYILTDVALAFVSACRAPKRIEQSQESPTRG